MKTHTVKVTTEAQPSVIDLTADVASFVRGEGDGLVNVSLLHATAGLALIEMHSGTERDLVDRIGALLPIGHPYSHAHGSPGHGASHVLPAFLTPTLTLPVVGGSLMLGRWQSLAMVDTNPDNRHREVLLSFLPAPS